MRAQVRLAKKAEKEEKERSAQLKLADEVETEAISNLAKEVVERAIASAIELFAEARAEEETEVEEEEEEEAAMAVVVTLSQPAPSGVPLQGEVMTVMVTADESADAEVAQITESVSNMDHPLPSDLCSDDTLVPTPNVSPAPSSESTEPPAWEEEVVEGIEAPVQEQPEMILYAIKKISNKRPILHIMDASNDPDFLSSRKVRRAKWVSDNVPESIRGKEYSMNHALCNLRDVLNPNNSFFGKKEGINFKVHLCTNEEGEPPQNVKRMMEKKEMAKFLL